MNKRDVFHAGEIAVQTRAGEREIAAGRESMIRHQLNEAASAFVATQEVVAAAATDSAGALWASLWRGPQGFVRGGAAGESVTVLANINEHVGDPVWSNVRSNAPLGLLVIDLVTRRRLRINGVVRRVDGAGFEVNIRETFGNCPKYIQKRVRADRASGGSVDASAPIERGRALDDNRRSLIAGVDTLFVASAHDERGIDVSHRGGHPGFVRVVGDRTVRIPDYPGNSMFQTLGNFEVDSRGGLAFVDFERRRILSATGRAVLEFGAEDAAHASGGTGRYWSFTVDQWIEFSLPPTLQWTLVERSPFNPL